MLLLRRLAAYVVTSAAFVAAFVPSIAGNENAQEYFGRTLDDETHAAVRTLGTVSVAVACSLQLCAASVPAPPYCQPSMRHIPPTAPWLPASE